MFYEECIDRKRTIQKAKHYLTFLGKHLNSVSYQEYLQKQANPMVVQEENVADYMHYSSSVIKLQPHLMAASSPLDIIHRKDMAKQQREERDLQIRWICFGLHQLPKKQRTYLVERYVYHLDNQTILKRHGIVESTLNRNIQKACFDLAIILKIEVMLEK